MKKLSLLSVLILAAGISASAQKYVTKDGTITFHSSTPIEDIKAENRKVSSALDSKTGDIVFNVLIKSFDFPNALMEEHFNENYMESTKYPNAKFAGKVQNIASVNFAKDGSYNVTVKGKLTLHNVTREITTTGTIKIEKGVVTAVSEFKINPKDYNISIPAEVAGKIAEEITVSVNMKYKKS